MQNIIRIFLHIALLHVETKFLVRFSFRQPYDVAEFRSLLEILIKTTEAHI